MNENEWGEPETREALWKKEHELRSPIESDYARSAAPLRRRRDQDVANIERDFAEKTRLAKSRLASAQREFKETMSTLKRWRDATVAAIEREYETERKPLARDKKVRLEPIQQWKDRQWERIRDANTKKES